MSCGRSQPSRRAVRSTSQACLVGQIDIQNDEIKMGSAQVRQRRARIFRDAHIMLTHREIAP